jgi:hypothetical protein
MGAKIEPESQVPPPGGASQPSSHLHLVSAATSPTQKIPDKRKLSEAELIAARKVFGAGLKYEVVSVEKMGSFTELINGSRAYTMGNTINLPGKAHAYPHQYVSVIIHELVHVWQYQHGGWGYVPSAVKAQLFGDGYDFAKALREGKPWAKMNPEQQGQMIQDAFRGAYFEMAGSRFGVLNNKGAVVRPGAPPPDGFTDYTQALLDALAVLQKT